MEVNFEKPKSKYSPEEILLEKERSLQRFNELRFDFIEEFPTERLLPHMPNYHRYKCRTNFFGTVLSAIIRAKMYGLIHSPEVLKEYDEFSQFCESNKRTKRFYVQEDIDKANKVLDTVIKELSD